ncbi:hypothetical protein BU23DRAFT_647562 [Bimuria novae-zelandiae CBS 107.79]|uniref:Uncharacterized protein n=1 Tax=Bimuria novae-zelandiae CBS 107.79 TaxID=1447943 RepID=A0A6A5VVM3_9PLEO|nr:hypothetical protein BU23DRAFT_647562 [Bimuria novae-zelandiae CBS 107.79]
MSDQKRHTTTDQDRAISPLSNSTSSSTTYVTAPESLENQPITTSATERSRTPATGQENETPDHQHASSESTTTTISSSLSQNPRTEAPPWRENAPVPMVGSHTIGTHLANRPTFSRPRDNREWPMRQPIGPPADESEQRRLGFDWNKRRKDKEDRDRDAGIAGSVSEKT